MRLRTHIVASALTGLLIFPRSPGRALGVLLSGTLIDIDHYLLYALETGDWRIEGALVYNRYRHIPREAGDNRPRYGSLRSWLHHPLLVLPPIWVAASKHPALRPIAIGLSLHLLLDHIWWPAYTLAFWRSGRRCMGCGQTDGQLIVYWRRDWGEPAFRTLCRACFERNIGYRQGSVVH